MSDQASLMMRLGGAAHGASHEDRTTIIEAAQRIIELEEESLALRQALSGRDVRVRELQDLARRTVAAAKRYVDSGASIRTTLDAGSTATTQPPSTPVTVTLPRSVWMHVVEAIECAYGEGQLHEDTAQLFEALRVATIEIPEWIFKFE